MNNLNHLLVKTDKIVHGSNLTVVFVPIKKHEFDELFAKFDQFGLLIRFGFLLLSILTSHTYIIHIYIHTRCKNILFTNKRMYGYNGKTCADMSIRAWTKMDCGQKIQTYIKKKIKS